MTAITREVLRPLEGQLVYLAGFMETWREGGSGFDACLRNVSIHPWDGEQAIRSCSKEVQIDHAWIRISGDIDGKRPERLLSYEAIGRVCWYRRSDGSVDLGLERVMSLCLERCLETIAERIRSGATWGERLECLNTLLEFAESQGGGQVYSHVKATTEALDQLRQMRDQLRRDQAVNFRALSSAAGRGPCSGLDAGVRFKRSKPRTAAGFV